MTIGHIKPLLAERAAAANATRSPGAGSGFAAVAAKISESEPQAAIASAQTPTTPTAAPPDGLAAMRLALARMGAGSTGATATPPPATAKGAIVDAGSKDADAGGAAKLPPLTGRDLHDMLKLQTGSFDPSLYERLGAHYNDYVNAYGAGGYYYDPTAVTLAAMSDSELEKLKTQYASPQAWLEKHGWYAHAVAAAPSSWDDLARARMA